MKTKLRVLKARLLFRATMKVDVWAQRLEEAAIVASETAYLDEDLLVLQ